MNLFGAPQIQTVETQKTIKETLEELSLDVNQLFKNESKSQHTQDYVDGFRDALLDCKNLIKRKIT